MTCHLNCFANTRSTALSRYILSLAKIRVQFTYHKRTIYTAACKEKGKACIVIMAFSKPELIVIM